MAASECEIADWSDFRAWMLNHNTNSAMGYATSGEAAQPMGLRGTRQGHGMVLPAGG